MKTEHIVTKLNELKQSYLETAKQMFTEGTTELFEAYPLLDSFGFTAYSPYFNDGDACTFNIHCGVDYGMYINGYCNDDKPTEEEGGQGKFESRDADEYIWKRTSHYDYSNGFNKRVKIDGEPEIDSMINSVNEFVNSFPTDVWEELIGNHVMVRITREGIETADYSDHD
jgi:hypothetical protein